jgi:hypothetical protein
MQIDWPPMIERGPQIPETAVAAFEADLGVRLPDDYRAFLCEVNGGRTALGHRVFAVRQRGTRTDRAVLDSLHGIDAKDAQSDLSVQLIYGRSWLPAQLLAVGYDGLGCLVTLVISGPLGGQIWFLDGRPRLFDDTALLEHPDAVKLADSFGAFLAALRPLNELT